MVLYISHTHDFEPQYFSKSVAYTRVFMVILYMCTYVHSASSFEQNLLCSLSMFRIFAQQCKNIEELCLEGCKRISDRYVFMSLNSTPIWWAWELVPSKVDGGPMQIPGTAGRFHGNPVSGNQPCKQPPASTVTVKEPQWRNLPYLTRYLPWTTSYEGWEGLGAKLAK